MKAWISRLIDRLVDGPQCPDCPHLAHGHIATGCLCSVPIDNPLGEPQTQRCQCGTPYGGSARSERRTRRQMAGVVA